MVLIARSEIRGDVRDAFPPAPSRAALAFRDLADGLSRSWMWTALALQDIRMRYRGSLLGPFWLTISTIVMSAALGMVYSQLFRMELGSYLPYLTIGLVVWQLIAGLINEGCDTFLRAEGVIQQVPIPFSIHVYRTVCGNFLVLAHSLVLVPVLFVLFDIPVGWQMLEVIPAVLLLAVNGVWISLFLGMISARFRDVPPIVANFLQVLFFLTPVIYPVDSLRQWRYLATYNPFFAAIDVLRAPLLGQAPSESSWLLLVISTILGCALTFPFFARFRARIAYWI